jgi:hypothetical protein
LQERRAALGKLTLDKGLKPLCREYGLPTTGKKARLSKHIASSFRRFR